MAVYDESMRNLVVGDIIAGLIRISFLLVIGYGVHRLARRVSWPSRGSRLRFAFTHMAIATVSVMVWYVVSSVTGHLLYGQPMEGGFDEFMVIGGYLYIVIVGVSYAIQSSERAKQAEAAAAQMQLSALRAQLQPHFLFNALHTVVQLIPSHPARAMEAAELVADLLRTTMEDDRDVISLGDEWAFVSRYLELEGIRFGDRLRVHPAVDPELLDVRVPSFALQTLVENAVRHGAAPRIAPTDIIITATGTEREVTLTVRNTGDTASTNGAGQSTGTGLKRLQERLAAMHGKEARLTYGPRDNGDYEAVVVVPRQETTEK